jgi:UrcA family protein
VGRIRESTLVSGPVTAFHGYVASTPNRTHYEEIAMKRSINAVRALRRGAVQTAWIAVAATGFACATASADGAVAGDDAPAVVVRYHAIDTDSESGALALYKRIEAAAGRVCGVAGERDLNRLRVARRCQEDAITRAVSSIPSPKLAALLVERRPFG